MSIHSSANDFAAQMEHAAAPFSAGLFTGQTVFITGGTSGIGAATACLFHALGANVIAAGLAVSSAPIRAKEGLAVIELDVSDETMMLAEIARLERLDHLVLSAGISLGSAETELPAFRRVLEVNLTACLTGAMAAVPLLAQQGGSITTLASMYAYFGGAARPAYAASKGGIVQLTKSLAQLLATQNIRANAVAPGWIDTPLAKGLKKRDKAEIIRRIPAGRWGQAFEIASAIAFLSSPAASYITGAVLPVDGGYLVA